MVTRFYKKFRIADLDRVGIPVEASRISLAHANNTLILSVCQCDVLCFTSVILLQYEKPAQYTTYEAKYKAMRDALKVSEEGDVDCKNQ